MQVIQDGFELTERKVGKSPLGDDRFKNIIKTKRNKNYIEDLEITRIYQLRTISGFLSLFNFDYYLVISNNNYFILRTSTKNININSSYEDHTITDINEFNESSTITKIIIHENMIITCGCIDDKADFRYTRMLLSTDFNKRDCLVNLIPETLCNNLSYFTEFYTYSQNKIHSISLDKILLKNSNDDILLKISFINEVGVVSPVFNLTFEHNNSYFLRLNLTDNINEYVIKKPC